MASLRSKIRGMLLGVAIGDALGMPVEGYNADEISVFLNKQGKSRLTQYHVNPAHKWFKDRKPGTWTDDTQLTLAVAEGIIASFSKGIYGDTNVMTEIANQHVVSLEKWGDRGFGGTTREAIKAVKAGTPWNEAAPTGTRLGYGNGVVMKLSPLAAAISAPKIYGMETLVEPLTKMTHNREVAVSGSHAMIAALGFCLRADRDKFSLVEFIKDVVTASLKGWTHIGATAHQTLVTRLVALGNWPAYNEQRIIQEFGGGSVAVYDSLPFSLMFFVRDCFTPDSVFDCIRSGGDTDSTGSMVASLLGALHGEEIWHGPLDQSLFDGLDEREHILKTADRLCDVLDIPNG